MKRNSTDICHVEDFCYLSGDDVDRRLPDRPLSFYRRLSTIYSGWVHRFPEESLGHLGLFLPFTARSRYHEGRYLYRVTLLGGSEGKTPTGWR